MPEVRLFGGLREAADGAESIQLEGTTIRELLEDKDRRRVMGEAGRRKVRERYTWDIIVDQYRKVYQQAAKRG